MVQAHEIQEIISSGLPHARVLVSDPMQDGTHLQAVVASEHFVGLPLIKQHKMVMDTVREVLEDRLHALQLKTMTLEEFDKEFT